MRKILVLLLLAAPLILSCTSSTASRKEAQEEKGVKEYPMAVDVKKFEQDYAKVHGNELKKMRERGQPLLKLPLRMERPCFIRLTEARASPAQAATEKTAQKKA